MRSLATDFSRRGRRSRQANSRVTVGVGAQRAPRRCLGSNDGIVAEVTFTGDDGA